MSGTIGFYTLGVESAHFRNLTLSAVKCGSIRPKEISAPPPPQCSHYRQTYEGGRFKELYDTNGVWHHVLDLGGREAIQEISGGLPSTLNEEEKDDDDEREPAFPYAILKGNKDCRSGRFWLDFYPTCEDSGYVGLIFAYANPSSFIALRVFSDHCDAIEYTAGHERLIAMNSDCKFSRGKWNMMSGGIHNGVIEAHIATSESKKSPAYLRTSRSNFFNTGYRLGFVASECPGVGFDQFRLAKFLHGSPEDSNNWLSDSDFLSPPSSLAANRIPDILSRESEEEMRFRELQPKKKNKNNIFSHCIPNNFLDAQKTCQKFQPYVKCDVSDFCLSCCDHFLSLLPTDIQEKCMQNCQSQMSMISESVNFALEISSICRRRNFEACQDCCKLTTTGPLKENSTFNDLKDVQIFCMSKCLKN